MIQCLPCHMTWFPRHSKAPKTVFPEPSGSRWLSSEGSCLLFFFALPVRLITVTLLVCLVGHLYLYMPFLTCSGTRTASTVTRLQMMTRNTNVRLITFIELLRRLHVLIPRLLGILKVNPSMTY